MRLLIDIGKLLGKCFVRTKKIIYSFFVDILVENHSDDASSMKTALKVCLISLIIMKN